MTAPTTINTSTMRLTELEALITDLGINYPTQNPLIAAIMKLVA